MHKKSIITGALILTTANIITRILGFVYRIYMSNVIGAEGMGLYQLIMPIYSLAWSLACSGFTTTVSKLTAQENAKKEDGNVKRILKISVGITTCLGLILFFILYFSAPYIGKYFYNDERIILSLKILSFAIPFMATGSCVRGYFYGLQETLMPAINQVLEQVVRMIVIYLLAASFIPRGIEYACAAATIGIVAEEIFSLLFVAISYKASKNKKRAYKAPSMTISSAMTLVVTMAIPLTANRVTGSMLSAVENALIPQRLQLYGYSAKEAISLYGQISGMAMPLIYFPSAFLLSLSISLVPAVSEASAMKNYKRINSTASKSLLFAAVIGFAAAALFIVFSKELGTVIYKQDISHMLILLGIMCPFIYMQVVLSGILNGLGYQVFIFRNSLISSVISIVFVYFLIPLKGLDAYIMGWFASLIVVSAFEIAKLREDINLEFEFSDWFFKPLISATAAAFISKFISSNFIINNFSNVMSLMLSICVLMVFYLIFIILTGCLSIREIKELFKNIKPSKA